MGRSIHFFHHFLNLDQEEVVISYKGPITSMVLYEVSKYIQTRLIEDPKAGKKVYSIFMELAQNVLNYSADLNLLGKNSEERVGSLVILESADHYILVTGNLIEQRYRSVIEEKCSLINSLDRDGLRRLRFEQREAPSMSPETKGAGIGLIHIALTSSNPLRVEFWDVDEHLAFFAISIQVNKAHLEDQSSAV